MSKWFIEEVRYPEVPDFDHIKYEPIESERTRTMSEFDKMVEFLDSTYLLKDQLVPCLIGPVGIGKTAAVNKHAENVKAKRVVEIIASQILPNEVSGMTMPCAETKAMEIYDHFRLSSLEDGDILFFDELLEADQMVLSACLTLIEDRRLMSGRKLPDIQIVAATNPTIQPSMLKESIRNRFLFRKFDLDRTGTREFIKQDCGIDVGSLTHYLVSSGNNYNILSPRSLTKMARWMASATNRTQGKKIAAQIDNIWENSMGSTLYNERFKYNLEQDAKDKLKQAVSENHDDLEVDWKNTSLNELMKIIMGLPDWDKISECLSHMEMGQDIEPIQTITF